MKAPPAELCMNVYTQLGLMKTRILRSSFIVLARSRDASVFLAVDYYFVLSPIHTADATKLFCRVGVSGVNTLFATSSRGLPTDSVDNFETDQTDFIAFDYTNFDRY